MMLRHIAGDDTADTYSQWTYSTAVTTNANNPSLAGYGGQLIDADGKCLGWVPASGQTAVNFAEGTVQEVRIQWVECLTGTLGTDF
jgi:hypothetical protein